MTKETEQNRDTLIQIFTRTPIEGEVKTRLIPRLGAQSSCELHKRMTLHTLQVATHASPAVEIWCTPDCSHPFLANLSQTYETKLQTGKSLADRMSYSLTRGLEKYQKVILVGCDCPAIDKTTLVRAISMLDKHDYVIIPVEDGGFSLIGSVLFSPAIFQEVLWGSNLVMSQMRENLKKCRHSWTELPTLWDVDEFVDYERLSRHMPHLTSDL